MAPKSYDQPRVDVTLVPVVERAISNKNAKKPRCPLCPWEGTVNYWERNGSAVLSKLRRHVREKHRVYYNLAQSKPFVINEEEEGQIWLSITQS